MSCIALSVGVASGNLKLNMFLTAAIFQWRNGLGKITKEERESLKKDAAPSIVRSLSPSRKGPAQPSSEPPPVEIAPPTTCGIAPRFAVFCVVVFGVALGVGLGEGGGRAIHSKIP